MINIFNRKEVYMGMSSQKFNEIREILTFNNIKYKSKVINSRESSFMVSSRARTGTFGEKLEYEYTYYIYVHKDDYDYACNIISK